MISITEDRSITDILVKGKSKHTGKGKGGGGQVGGGRREFFFGVREEGVWLVFFLSTKT